MNRGRHGTGIKWRMIRLLVLCWIVPIGIASFLVSFVMSRRLSGQMQETVTNSLSNVANIIESSFDECHKESRNATYLGVVYDAYNSYLGSGDEQKLYSDITMYLTGQYRYNKRTNSVMLFFTDNPRLFYSTYDSSSSINDVQSFKVNAYGEVLDLSNTIDTSIYLYKYDSKLYLVRNLVSTAYKPYAMIVMQINPDEMFGSLKSVWGYKSAAVYVDSERVYGEVSADFLDLEKDQRVSLFKQDGDSYYTYYSDKIDGQIVTYVVELDSNIIMSEQKVGHYILLILLFSLIPLGIAVIWFFDRMVSKPMEELVTAAGEIANENYGYEIKGEAKSTEFILVNEAFNKMSMKLKQQFEQIYLEELAVRDANIKALQSQINPHFINNTLEIINWEARLNGVYKVSGMIEALSTMLNATLNRKSVQSIPLYEELKYVDAYLYIISERMGKRLTIEKEIDESLLSEPVPRLIAQPIVENAVEHGVTTQGNGKITIKVYAKDEYMYMEVRNTGHMSEKDKEKIEAILNGVYDEKNEKSVSIGISNVNKRLKLMYGDNCGLTIKEDEEGTVSLLTFMREGGDANE